MAPRQERVHSENLGPPCAYRVLDGRVACLGSWQLVPCSGVAMALRFRRALCSRCPCASAGKRDYAAAPDIYDATATALMVCVFERAACRWRRRVSNTAPIPSAATGVGDGTVATQIDGTPL